MDARLSYIQDRPNRFDPPPVLIAATSDSARARAVRSVQASGFRVADAVPIDEAAARLRSQTAATAIWFQLDQDAGPALDEAIRALNEEGQRASVVVAAPLELTDLLFATLADGVQLLVDPDDSECAAALAIAAARREEPLRLSDISADKDSARLRQLSDEVTRIASTLARLSQGNPRSFQRPADEQPGDVPAPSADEVRAVIRARRARSKYLSEDLFADPAWDMLLDLLQAELLGLQIQVSSLCVAAAVPPTTALRWLTAMTRRGLFVRRQDPHDGRRVFVELSPEASLAMRRYFAEIRATGGV
jgi:DNA-binding MarR family transcriptional regulator